MDTQNIIEGRYWLESHGFRKENSSTWSFEQYLYVKEPTFYRYVSWLCDIQSDEGLVTSEEKTAWDAVESVISRFDTATKNIVEDRKKKSERLHEMMKGENK